MDEYDLLYRRMPPRRPRKKTADVKTVRRRNRTYKARHIARETPEQYERRLKYQRDYYHANKKNGRPDPK